MEYLLNLLWAKRFQNKFFKIEWKHSLNSTNTFFNNFIPCFDELQHVDLHCSKIWYFGFKMGWFLNALNFLFGPKTYPKDAQQDFVQSPKVQIDHNRPFKKIRTTLDKKPIGADSLGKPWFLDWYKCPNFFFGSYRSSKKTQTHFIEI